MHEALFRSGFASAVQVQAHASQLRDSLRLQHGYGERIPSVRKLVGRDAGSLLRTLYALESDPVDARELRAACILAGLSYGQRVCRVCEHSDPVQGCDCTLGSCPCFATGSR